MIKGVGMKTKALKISALFILMLFQLVSALAAVDSRQISDTAITRAVETRLASDEMIDANRFNVITRQGIVTVSGKTDNILEKERITRVVSTIKGVVAIVNQVEVEPVRRSDAALLKAVKKVLNEDPSTHTFHIKVKVEGGVVTLEGTTDSWQEKQFSAQVAKRTPGVRRVVNKIKIVYTGKRSDQAIERDVEARLRNDAAIDPTLILVSVRNGTVILSGEVGSVAEKKRAIEDAWVNGVERVEADKLKVSWWIRDKMRRKDYAKRPDDKQIRKAIETAFVYDPRIEAGQARVTVESGNVILTGIVDNLRAKRAAEADARNVIGVRSVKNHLKVRPKQIPSADVLADRVKRALRNDPVLAPYKLDVTAISGRVYISGEVNNEFERNTAELIAARTKGVSSVRNKITYAPKRWVWKKDWEIKQEIRERYSFNPYLDTRDVKIEVKDGIVTLTGEVKNWRQRTAAAENARKAGARAVINKLRIRHPEENATDPSIGF